MDAGDKRFPDLSGKQLSWRDAAWWQRDLINFNFRITRQVSLLILIIIVLLVWAISVSAAKFENKPYDPYGTGIRFFQSRDDTGSPYTTLEDRQVGGEKLVIEPLTSNPEPPNISEYYGIEANLKNGSVMIERENFENSALNMDDLMKANKGM